MPTHKACTQYSHVCFTRPRCETCEHPIQRALVSFLPSPQNLHSVESWTVEKEDSDVCVSVWRVLLLMGDNDRDVLGSIELVDGTSSFCWGPSWTLIFPKSKFTPADLYTYSVPPGLFKYKTQSAPVASCISFAFSRRVFFLLKNDWLTLLDPTWDGTCLLFFPRVRLETFPLLPFFLC